MLTSTGSSGLYKAPVSKSLLLVPSACSVLLVFLFQRYVSYFEYNLQAVKEDFQIWRLFSGRTICLDLKDAFCSSLLVYNFRIFERRYGSRKFTSFLLATWVLSALFEFLLVEASQHAFGITVNQLPSGFLAPVFALYVPFYLAIPGVQVTMVLGHFPVSNKTLIYIVGLQLLTSSPAMLIIALSGLAAAALLHRALKGSIHTSQLSTVSNLELATMLHHLQELGLMRMVQDIQLQIAGICYYSNLWEIDKVLYVPSWVAKIFSSTLEPMFSSTRPTFESREGMGATLDIQRQQRLELLDQQILLSQFAARGQARQPQVGMLNWSRLFTPLRHGLFATGVNNRNQAHADHQPAASEEQITQLVDMGFSRADVLEAMRVSNNDVNLATNVLLQR